MPAASPAPAAPITQADENSSIRDALGILCGIFLALMFIAGSSFEVRYITSHPSQLLIPGQVIGFTLGKGEAFTARITKIDDGLSAKEAHACTRQVGDTISLPGPKSWMGYFEGDRHGERLLRLKDLPENLKCVRQVAVPRNRA